MAKLSAAYSAIADKLDAQPYVQLIVKDKDGKDLASAKLLAVENNKTDWQNLSFDVTVEKDAAYVAVAVGLNWIKADVLFDNLTVEIDPGKKTETPVATPKTPAPTPATPATPPDPAKILADLAAKAPAAKLEMGGINFGPELAASMQKLLPKISGTKNTIVFAGPGLPMAELDKKLPAGWSGVQSKETSGAAAAPRNLFITLPDYLAKQKPEVVYLFGETAVTRKLDSTERLDWEDLGRLCIRMGALPVLAAPPATGNEQKDELRNIMMKAADDPHCPLVEARAGLIGARIGELTDMLQRYVLGRVPPDAPEAHRPVKTNED